MSIMSRFNRFAENYRAARAAAKTEASIRALPLELQRDIGWPHAYRHNTVNKVVAGDWY